jgi:hypothetical protein
VSAETVREHYRKQGREQERERIIKLLEENHLTAASELIEQDAKGENK